MAIPPPPGDPRPWNRETTISFTPGGPDRTILVGPRCKPGETSHTATYFPCSSCGQPFWVDHAIFQAIAVEERKNLAFMCRECDDARNVTRGGFAPE